MHSFFRLSVGIAVLSLALVFSGCVVTSMVATSDTGTPNAQVGGGETLYDGVPAARLRVFLTSTTYAGKSLGGVGGANAFCKARADAAGLTQRKYAALIRHSTGAGHSGISMNKPLALYNSVTDSETELADSLTAVFAGQALAETINLTETSATISTAAPIPVWTGMTSAGATDANHCAKWLSTGIGRIGDAAQRSSNFYSNANSANCDVAYRLICIGEVGATVNYTIEAVAAPGAGVGGLGAGGGEET